MTATADQVLGHAPAHAFVRRKKPVTLGLVARYAVLLVTILITLFPLLWLVVTSLRLPNDIFAVPVHIIPSSVTYQQYINVFTQYNLAGYVWNTVVVSLVTVVCVIVLAIPCAYAMARFRLPGRRLILSLLLVMRMIPVVALAIPLFAVFASLGMLDTLSSLILAHTASKLPIAIWLLIGFVQDLPKEIEESAQMDGAGTFRIIAQIVTPLIAPGVGAARRDYVPVHLERPLDRLDADFERKCADPAGRLDQFRVAIRHRLGRDVGGGRADGGADSGVCLVRSGAPGQGAGERRGAWLKAGRNDED